MDQNDLERKDNNLPAIVDDQIIEVARLAEQRVAAMRTIKSAALSLTSKFDWVDMSGKPYMTVSGAEKIARLFGISWRIDEPQKDFLEGGHFMFTYKGEFSMGVASIEAIGVRASTDPFFSQKSVWENNQKKKVAIPPSEIDVGDVKKAALTNCLGNGISRMLGIRNLTWEEVEHFAHVKRTDVGGKVDFKKDKGTKDKPHGTENGTVTKEPPEGGFISESDLAELLKYAQDLKIPKMSLLKEAGASAFNEIPASKVKDLVVWMDAQAAA